MTIIAMYDTLIADIELQPQPGCSISIRIFTALDSSEEIRILTDLWDLVPVEELDRLIHEIISAKFTWSREKLQSDPINGFIYEKSESRYQLLHCKTVYDSNRPDHMLISIEIGSVI